MPLLGLGGYEVIVLSKSLGTVGLDGHLGICATPACGLLSSVNVRHHGWMGSRLAGSASAPRVTAVHAMR